MVVLPWVPAIAIARRPAATAATACWRRHTGMPACAAATSSGLSDAIALDVITTLGRGGSSTFDAA